MTPHPRPAWNGDKLREARLAAGYTQEALAEAITMLDGAPQALAGTIRGHESSEHRPGPRYQRAYGHILGRSETELGFRIPRPVLPGDAVALTSPATDAPPSRRPGEEVSPTNRRDVLSLTAAALGISAAATVTATDRLAILERATAGTGAASTAESALQTVVADYLHHPPAETLRRAMSLQQLTDAISTEYVLRPADQARVWRVSAIATGMRGWLENNAGRTNDARLSLREAHRRGELLEDPQIIAWTRYLQAVVEDYAGNPAKAEQYARDGLHHATAGPQRALLLVDGLAGSLASRGDTAGVNAAVIQAEGIVSRLEPADHGKVDGVRTIVDDLDTISPSIFALAAGRAYARLGQPSRFADVTAQTRAETIYREPLFRADEAVAVAHSSTPDLDQVVTLTRDSLDLARPFQTAHITSRVNIVLTVTVPHSGYHPIHELADQTRAWQEARSATARST